MKTQYVKGYKRYMKSEAKQSNVIIPIVMIGSIIVLFAIIFWKVTILLGFGSLFTHIIKRAF